MLESLQAFGQALGNFTDSTLWIWLLIGSVFGVLIGIIPGIGALEALALCLPFAFKLQPMEALPLMIAIAATSFTGG
jgi:putative tricarboxylic transport membrane protein